MRQDKYVVGWAITEGAGGCLFINSFFSLHFFPLDCSPSSLCFYSDNDPHIVEGVLLLRSLIVSRADVKFYIRQGTLLMLILKLDKYLKEYLDPHSYYHMW